MGEWVVEWMGGWTNMLVQIGLVKAEILLIWTNVIRTYVVWTNVTVTAGI